MIFLLTGTVISIMFIWSLQDIFSFSFLISLTPDHRPVMVLCVHQVSDVQSVCNEPGSTLLDEKSNHIEHKKVCSICGHNDGCWWCINNPHWCLISLLSLELISLLTGAEPPLLLYISDVFELSLAQQTDKTLLMCHCDDEQFTPSPLRAQSQG